MPAKCAYRADDRLRQLHSVIKESTASGAFSGGCPRRAVAVLTVNEEVSDVGLVMHFEYFLFKKREGEGERERHAESLSHKPNTACFHSSSRAPGRSQAFTVIRSGEGYSAVEQRRIRNHRAASLSLPPPSLYSVCQFLNVLTVLKVSKKEKYL